MYKEFKSYTLSREGHRRQQMITEVFNLCMSEVAKLVPVGRELSAVRARLEEAHMFASKGMSSVPGNNEIPPPSSSIAPEANE